MLELKNTEFKDIDIQGRIVKGYFSVFDNVDSDGDIIRKGAYEKTLKANRSRIQHLWQHNPHMPIGKLQELKEDSKGLYFESKLSDTALGNDVLKLYKEGIIREHSVGFEVKDQIQSDHREITEIKLWEGSTVTWGANELAQVSKAFSFLNYNGDDFNLIETLKARIEELRNSLARIEGTQSSKSLIDIYNEVKTLK